MSGQQTGARAGAPWWLVAVLAVALVAGLGLTLGLAGADDTGGESFDEGTVASRPAEPSPAGRDTDPVELPAEAAGLRIPEDDPTGLDRERTRDEIASAADGVGADVATYVDGDRPAFTVTAARMDSVPLFSVRRPPEEAADVVVEVEQVGDVRCQVAGTGDQTSVVQCLRSSPDLTVVAVPFDPAGTTVRETAVLVDGVTAALG